MDADPHLMLNSSDDAIGQHRDGGPAKPAMSTPASGSSGIPVRAGGAVTRVADRVRGNAHYADARRLPLWTW